MKHQFVQHTNCTKTNCPICDGGLAVCEVCNGAESSLPTECPGHPISIDMQDLISAGKCDFINNKWEKYHE